MATETKTLTIVIKTENLSAHMAIAKWLHVNRVGCIVLMTQQNHGYVIHCRADRDEWDNIRGRHESGRFPFLLHSTLNTL